MTLKAISQPMDHVDKPLRKKLFYLDLKISRKQDVTILMKELRSLGGEIEAFFSKDISYVITDRPNWKLDAKCFEQWVPDTPTSTWSPYSFIKCDFGESVSPLNEADVNRSQLQTSRGQRLLEQSTKHHKRHGSTDVLEISRQWGIRILPISTVLRWLDKTRKSMDKILQKKKVHKKSDSVTVMGTKILTSAFIKVEDKRRMYRTFYKEFTAWPDVVPKSTALNKKSCLRENVQNISYDRNKQDPVAEGFAVKTHDVCKKTTIKENREPKRKGYCEICSETFTNLQQHLTTKYHRNFLSDKTNFLQLNKVLTTLPACDDFLSKNGELRLTRTFNRSKMGSSKEPTCTETKNRKRVATKLAQRFDLFCPTAQNQTATKSHTEKSVEDERIEQSCYTPPYDGFLMLDRNTSYVVENRVSCPKSYAIFPTPSHNVVQSSFLSLPVEGDCEASSHFETIPDGANLEISNVNLTKILTPSKSILCYSDEITRNISTNDGAAKSELVINNESFVRTQSVTPEKLNNNNCEDTERVDVRLPSICDDKADVMLHIRESPSTCTVLSKSEEMLINKPLERSTTNEIDLVNADTGNQCNKHDDVPLPEPENSLLAADHLGVPNMFEMFVEGHNCDQITLVAKNIKSECDPIGSKPLEHSIEPGRNENQSVSILDSCIGCIADESCTECCLDCTECANSGCNIELLPLNLCMKNDRNPTENGLVSYGMTEVKRTPSTAGKRHFNEDNSPSRKIRVLTDRSVQSLFNSDDEELEFSGFRQDDRNRTSPLSYTEIACPSDITLPSDLSLQLPLDLSTSVGTEDDSWDGSMMEYIDRKVSNKYCDHSSIDSKVQPNETTQVDSTDPKCNSENRSRPQVSEDVSL